MLQNTMNSRHNITGLLECALIAVTTTMPYTTPKKQNAMNFMQPCI
jgi:hypothetical protein